MPIQLNEAVLSMARGCLKDVVRRFLTAQKKDLLFSAEEVSAATGFRKDSICKYKTSMSDLYFKAQTGQSIMWGHPEAIKKLKEMYAKQVG